MTDDGPDQLALHIRHFMAAKSMTGPEWRTIVTRPGYDIADVASGILAYLTRQVLSIPHPTELSFPADWWQALKERWFPGWMKARWPVEYKRYHVEAMMWDWHLPPNGAKLTWVNWRGLLAGGAEVTETT